MLFVTNRLQGSGVGQVLATKAAWLTQQGFHLRVLAIDTPATISGRPSPVLKELGRAGVTVTDLNVHGRLVLMRQAARVAGLALRHGRTVVGHGTMGSLLAVLAKTLALGRLRAVVELHGHPRVYEQEFNPTIIALTRRLFRRADAVLAPSRALLDLAAGYYRLDSARAHAIPNPLDLDRIATLAADTSGLPPSAREPFILGCGRLHVNKGFGDLVRAFRLAGLHTEMRLVILGEGRHRHRIEGAVREAALEGRVDLPGYVDNPYAYMARARALALPSDHGAEAFPLVLAEALACGTPVIASRCEFGPPEVLLDGMCGILHPVGDVEALARGLRHIIEAPEETRARAERGRLRAAEFALNAIMPSYARLYRGAADPPDSS